MCLSNAGLESYALKQIGHRTLSLIEAAARLSWLSWFRIWYWRLANWVKVLSQLGILHLNGRTPVWILKWVSKCACCLNADETKNGENWLFGTVGGRTAPPITASRVGKVIKPDLKKSPCFYYRFFFVSFFKCLKKIGFLWFSNLSEKVDKNCKIWKKDENDAVFLLKNMFFRLEWPKIIKDNKGSGWPGFNYNMVISRLWLF